jgi:hypothetical protein
VILRELLRKGSVSEHTFNGILSPNASDELLGANIFSSHFDSGEINFQSTVVKRYCQEN